MELLYKDQNYHDRRLPENLRRSYAKWCLTWENTPSIKNLIAITWLKFEHYQDHYSIRINQQRRIEFDYTNSGDIIIFNIFDVNNHYHPNF